MTVLCWMDAPDGDSPFGGPPVIVANQTWSARREKPTSRAYGRRSRTRFAHLKIKGQLLVHKSPAESPKLTFDHELRRPLVLFAVLVVQA
jgi:hypothetical protein